MPGCLAMIACYALPHITQEVNYGYNEIEEIPDLSPHQALTTLVLDGGSHTLMYVH